MQLDYLSKRLWSFTFVTVGSERFILETASATLPLVVGSFEYLFVFGMTTHITFSSFRVIPIFTCLFRAFPVSSIRLEYYGTYSDLFLFFETVKLRLMMLTSIFLLNFFNHLPNLGKMLMYLGKWSITNIALGLMEITFRNWVVRVNLMHLLRVRISVLKNVFLHSLNMLVGIILELVEIVHYKKIYLLKQILFGQI